MSVAQERKEIIRPLKTLEGLIKEKLKQADEAAEAAREPYYREAAPLLIEARDNYFSDSLSGFYDWATRKFERSQRQISTWVAWGSRDHSKYFKNLEEHRITPKAQGGLGQPRSRLDRPWTGPVNEVAERARREAFRLAQEDALTRAQEREAERKLALRLIDIGYKVLAKELHPDKLHGDRDAMARLNRVKEKLRHCI